MGQEIFSIMRGRAGMGQEKSMRGGDEDPIRRPRSAPLPSPGSTELGIFLSLHTMPINPSFLFPMEPLMFTFYFTVEGYDVFITIELFPYIDVIMAESTINSS